jgi:hypothetical protein
MGSPPSGIPGIPRCRSVRQPGSAARRRFLCGAARCWNPTHPFPFDIGGAPRTLTVDGLRIGPQGAARRPAPGVGTKTQADVGLVKAAATRVPSMKARGDGLPEQGLTPTTFWRINPSPPPTALP